MDLCTTLTYVEKMANSKFDTSYTSLVSHTKNILTNLKSTMICSFAGRYCHMFLCVHCLKENVACTQNGQCCKGQCTYGRCKKDAAAGAPGTFCDRHDDCRDPPGTCCVRLVTRVMRNVCSPKLWCRIGEEVKHANLVSNELIQVKNSI